MNEKLCKKIRKMALTIAHQAQVHTGEEVPFTSYNENERNRKKVQSYARGEAGELLMDANGKPEMKFYECSLGTLTHAEVSIKGIYRKLKKDFKESKTVKAFDLKVQAPTQSQELVPTEA